MIKYDDFVNNKCMRKNLLISPRIYLINKLKLKILKIIIIT